MSTDTIRFECVRCHERAYIKREDAPKKASRVMGVCASCLPAEQREIQFYLDAKGLVIETQLRSEDL